MTDIERKPLITADRAREVLAYDPETGHLTWNIEDPRPGPQVKGKLAGSRHSRGYWHVGIDGRLYLAHRLIWLMVHGYWPEQVDHIDGNPANNALTNLRACSHSENHQNRSISPLNTSGVPGVRWDKSCRKWRATIKVNRERIHLGLFDSIDAAGDAYRQAKQKHHTFQPTVRIG